MISKLDFQILIAVVGSILSMCLKLVALCQYKLSSVNSFLEACYKTDILKLM